jgi:hypothetical protein
MPVLLERGGRCLLRDAKAIRQDVRLDRPVEAQLGTDRRVVVSSISVST